jgi:hypothetical protein
MADEVIEHVQFRFLNIFCAAPISTSNIHFLTAPEMRDNFACSWIAAHPFVSSSRLAGANSVPMKKLPIIAF